MGDNGHGIGEKIRQARLRAGWTQQQLANKLSVAQGLVSQWEIGKANPGIEWIKKLESILGGITSEDGTSEQPLSSISLWLSAALSQRDWTAYELSQKAGLSAATVYNLLNGGAQNPQQRTLKKLEAALGEKFESSDGEAFAVKGIGQLMDFNPHDPKDHPDRPGVYVFYDISFRPIYVGKANNISERIREHKEKFWFREPIVQTAAYIEIKDRDLRDQVETILIQFLKNNAVINKNKTARSD